MEQSVTSSSPDRSGLRVLVASSEVHPLVKTGGLADVASSLPAALRQLGHDVRLIIPAYPRAVKQLDTIEPVGSLHPLGSRARVQLLEARHPDHPVPIYLVDAPEHFAREGNPYVDLSGRDWGDNPERFLLFCQVIAEIGRGVPALGWRPEIIHGNDWQTGLAPALLHDEAERPALVFTIHNLAYQGLFDRATFDRLRLPPALWSLAGLEFHQRMSFIKGGIVFSDRVNTVSPTYAEEVKTLRFGCGLDGLLRQLGTRFQGILNGIDYRVWDPATDRLIPQRYGPETLELKASNKRALQLEFGLPQNERAIVFGYIGRLVEQKGVDLILSMLPRLLVHSDVQLVMQGSGDAQIEQAMLEATRAHPDQIGVYIGYDEDRAHRIEAGCDAFLMPSRFEPCGLNQMYSLRYGSVPIVHRTGGLADTVVNATPERLAEGSATGLLFDHSNADSLWHAVRYALRLYRDQPDQWRSLMRAGMRQDLSWERSARRYVALYEAALAERRSISSVA
ncbi:glycogen/starch synthase, ADP-glucose type [Thioflavicoccus mobilis 8321]|uniref:Glycogen synthase n=1 Tax=Thioflavicoccus mobilis 8321 TaxID=765912 RepID=L0H2A6_9GAMM|nr:glycogen synthase GlgA [Thioflavicoccus mobilis]AGA92177.1 glycogen/starch synthase, ADP-glucose type [Thioflavicoccus mobilis 8321]